MIVGNLALTCNVNVSIKRWKISGQHIYLWEPCSFLEFAELIFQAGRTLWAVI